MTPIDNEKIEQSLIESVPGIQKALDLLKEIGDVPKPPKPLVDQEEVGPADPV